MGLCIRTSTTREVHVLHSYNFGPCSSHLHFRVLKNNATCLCNSESLKKSSQQTDWKRDVSPNQLVLWCYTNWKDTESVFTRLANAWWKYCLQYRNFLILHLPSCSCIGGCCLRRTLHRLCWDNIFGCRCLSVQKDSASLQRVIQNKHDPIQSDNFILLRDDGGQHSDPRIQKRRRIKRTNSGNAQQELLIKLNYYCGMGLVFNQGWYAEHACAYIWLL